MSIQLFDLTGKAAVVTGGSRGIGRAIALGLAAAGADVAIFSRTEEELVATSIEIEGLGRKCLYSVLDVTNKADIEKCMATVHEEFGKIDILVNAAGLNVRRKFLEFTEDEWDFVLNVNLKGTMLTTQVVAPYMIGKSSGKIINIASLSSVLGFSDMAAYAASKGGVQQLTKSLAVEFAEHGINVNAIGPGYFSTKMTQPVFSNPQKVEWMNIRTPMKRTGYDEDIKGTAIFLASEASGYITGQTIFVDGGWLANA